MIQAVISRDILGHIQDFEITGHSGYADPGEDIVCAAVSAIVQTAIMGLNDVVGIEPYFEIKDGYTQCMIPMDITIEDREKTSIVLDTMLIGLKSIELSYEQYLSIEEREVE